MTKNIFIALITFGFSLLTFATPSSVIVGSVVNNVLNQGNLIESTSNFDIAIGGYGFLPLKNNNGETLYTRLGKLGMDKDGDLYHIPSGLKVITTSENGVIQTIALKAHATRSNVQEINKTAKMTAMRINKYGQIEAAYSNGELINIAQLKLVSFENARNLKVADEKKYLLSASKAVGDSAFLEPGEKPAGLIHNRYLESLSMKEYKKLLR